MADTTKLHIVVFPWLAFGHILPFLELSKTLARRGHIISFISTPRNIDRLPTLPPTLLPLINFITLPLPPTDGLPPTAEATTDLPPHRTPYLKKAFDGLSSPFTEFIHSISPNPNCIIIDFTHHWLPPIVAESNIPCIYFSVFLSSFLAFCDLPMLKPPGHVTEPPPESLTSPPEDVIFPTTVSYRLHEAREFVAFYRPNASGISDIDRATMTIQGCKAVAIRSCYEFEGEWVRLLERLYQKPIIPVGILPPPPPPAAAADDSRIMDWLDRQEPKSVVYVAFGSEATLTTKSLHELGLGLELSQLPFIWALRKPAGADGASILPEGFEERTKGRGMVAMHWVPQMKILAHGAVGGFLTHSGWSSVVESMQFGHPLILLPVFGDQWINASVMAEKEIGVRVETDEEDGSFGREDVTKALRFVMVEEEGEPIRLKVKEMRKVFGDVDMHEGYVDGFVRHLSVI